MEGKVYSVIGEVGLYAGRKTVGHIAHNLDIDIQFRIIDSIMDLVKRNVISPSEFKDYFIWVDICKPKDEVVYYKINYIRYVRDNWELIEFAKEDGVYMARKFFQELISMYHNIASVSVKEDSEVYDKKILEITKFLNMVEVGVHTFDLSGLPTYPGGYVIYHDREGSKIGIDVTVNGREYFIEMLYEEQKGISYTVTNITDDVADGVLRRQMLELIFECSRFRSNIGMKWLMRVDVPFNKVDPMTVED